MMKKKIYISYRRSDSYSGEIKMLFDQLSRRLVESELAIDIDFDFERSWEAQIEEESLTWDLVLVVIGPTWIKSKDSKGNPAIKSKDDFVRKEISLALSLSNTKVIPILIGDTRMPLLNQLPADLKSLLSLNSFSLHEKSWERDFEKLEVYLRNQQHESSSPQKESPIASNNHQDPKIFISHRHSDTQSDCRSLKTELTQVFGKENIFFDIESLTPGTRFGKVIENTLAISKIILVAIGPDWTGPKVQNGVPRIFEENDWVRKEVSKALSQTNSWVIPILMKNASLPKASDLPDELKPLVEIHSFEITNSRWDYDVKLLISHLEKLVTMNPE